MNKNTKIFKLISGEEIIGNLLNNDSDSVLKIENPMVFKTATMLDNRGIPHDITILKDWMYRSDEKIADLPKEQISISFNPNEKTLELYKIEISKNDVSSQQIFNSDDLKNNFANPLDEIMNSFMNNLTDLAKQEPLRKRRKGKKRRPLPPDPDELTLEALIPDELKERPMIYLSMVIPPECIMNLITSGVLDPEQLLEIIEEVKKKNNFTGDEKKREDFGNKLSDWNPDPKSADYNEEDPPGPLDS
jgi:hypothetical protein